MSGTYAASSQQRRTRTSSAARTDTGRRGQARDRVRGLTNLEVAVLILILIALVGGVIATGTHPPVAASRQQVRAEHGDTLWSIARSHPIPGQTTAQTADSIAQLNGLRSAHVQAGQTLSVPMVQEGVSLAAR